MSHVQWRLYNGVGKACAPPDETVPPHALKLTESSQAGEEAGENEDGVLLASSTSMDHGPLY